MKKFLPYILILIVIVGAFSPMAQVHAETYSECRNRIIDTYSAEEESLHMKDCNGLPGAPGAGGAAADVCADIDGIGNIICQIHDILTLIIPVIVALGLVYFVWGVVQYMIRDSEEAKKKGKDHIIYGLIGLAVIVGLWGLVNIVVRTFGLGGGSPPTLSAPTQNGAQMCSATNTILADNPKLQNLLTYFTCIIYKSVIPLVFALAVLMFVWGVVQYVINSAEEAKKEKGRQFMLWGIIALTVMVSIWGLVKIVGGTFGVDNPIIPQVSPAKRVI